MAASSEATPVSPDVDKTVSDKVAASAAEAVERLQRAAETIAADVRKAGAAQTRPVWARIGLGGYEAVHWRRAAAASALCAGVALAAVLGLRDSGRPNASQIASAEKAIQAKQAEDERKLQDVQARALALAEEVKALRAKLDKQAEEARAAQARAAAAAMSAGQAATRIDKAEREILAKLDKAERDQAAKFEQHTTRIERMERLVADPVVTSAIPKSSTNPPAALKTTADGKGTGEGYVLRGVHNGVATVQTSRGLIEVGPGDTIPGVGRVRAIQKVDGRWVVVMRDGVIDTD